MTTGVYVYALAFMALTPAQTDYDAQAAAALALAAAQQQPAKQAEPPAPAQPAPAPAAPADDQLQAYRDLCRWAEEHPGRLVIVYVQTDPPPDGSDYVEKHCRYDAGWPNVQTPTKVVAMFRDGQFAELRREPVLAHALPAGGLSREYTNTAVPVPAFQPFPAGRPMIQAVPAFPARPDILRRFGRLRGGTCGAGGCH